MDTRPKKRQRRFLALSSDNEEDGTVSKNTGKEKGKAGNCSSDGCANQPPQQSLPTRSRAPATTGSDKPPARTVSTQKRPLNEAVRNGSTKSKQGKDAIATFFRPRTAGQQPNRRALQLAREAEEASAASLEVGEEDKNDEEDAIEDDSISEKSGELPATQGITRRVLDRRKRSGGTPATTEKPPVASQVFRIPAVGKGKAISTQNFDPAKEVDRRPWAERYGPTSLEELAVHKKKVADVRMWLENALSGKSPKRLLILKGPSGSGKTATLELLAKSMEFELSEWRNPVGSDFSSEGYSSMSAQFEDFLSRSARFGKLDIVGGAREHTAAAIPTSEANSGRGRGRRKITLLEEFPNSFIRASVALRSFRCCIMEYLATNTPLIGGPEPKPTVPDVNTTLLVMIITETRLNTAAAATDNFTAHQLLGFEILSHPGVTVLEFNPVATTYLTKALELVLEKEARHSGRRRIPGPSVLKRLGEAGDVRSAIGSLEFLCVKGNDNYDWSGRIAARAKKGAQSSIALTKMEKESLEMVTQRESSLGLFHAVGKVVYNKREGPKAVSDIQQYMVQPPHHLSDHVRMRTSQVSVDQLIDETGTDTGTFVAALHENYVMSCEGPSFVDSLNGCLDALSDTDILSPSRIASFGTDRGNGGCAYRGAATEFLKHHEISFHLAVRGLLFALPETVRRSSHPVGVPGPRGGKGDSYKMFYPTSSRLWRRMDEVHLLLDRWVAHLQSSRITRPAARQCKSTKADEEVAVRNDSGTTEPQDSDWQELCRTSLYVNRSELLVERLPYISKIEQHNLRSGRFQELEIITQFNGICLCDEEPTDEVLDDTTPKLPDRSTGKPLGRTVQTLDCTASIVEPREEGKQASNAAFLAEEEVEKLYLTDDDIEDD
ncbi:MAG: hypothetical protein Q9163_001660 [Psora crenata]